MRHPPRKLTDRVIDHQMQLGVLLVGLVMALVTLLTIDLKLPGGLVEGSSGLVQARTAGFTVLVLVQLFNCFNSRSDRVSAFRGLFTNRWLWAAIALSLLLQVLVVHVPLLNRAFGTPPVGRRLGTVRRPGQRGAVGRRAEETADAMGGAAALNRTSARRSRPWATRATAGPASWWWAAALPGCRRSVSSAARAWRCCCWTDEPGVVHRLDRRHHRLAEPGGLADQAAQPVSSRRCGGVLDRLAGLVR
jgi:hypothetical protein